MLKAWGAVLLWGRIASADGVSDLYATLQGWKPLRISDSAPTIREPVLRAAMGGSIQSGVEFVAGVEAGKGWGLGVISAPTWAIWQAILDARNLHRFLPVDLSTSLRGFGRDGAVVFQYMSLPVVTDRWWCIQQKHNRALYTASAGRAWELTWRDRHSEAVCQEGLPEIAAGGMAVAWSRGAWMLVDLGDGRTLTEYHTWADPGGSLPAEQASRFAAGKVADTIRGIETAARWQQDRSSQGFVRPDGAPLR